MSQEEYLADHPRAVTDPVKAVYEAHGEKPFREDAIELGKMVVRAETIAQKEDSEDTYDVYGGPINEHAYRLKESQRTAVAAAEAAGDMAGQAYDRAKKSQEELEALTSAHS